jgi:energy-coupling factor transporter ATP-binding protein EcfA2
MGRLAEAQNRLQTSMTQPTLKLNFPTLRRVTLRQFSLFTAAPEVDESIAPGVFCLAGANGLGKSTFLSAVNFAMTGLVSDPELKFASVDEYYKNGRDFARDYFKGRISEDDRDAAEVALEFAVGEHVYELTRAVFDGDELRALMIHGPQGAVVLDGTDLSETDRHARYTEQLTSDLGLASFEQFVFIQHFILTFDERRHLLFWDEKVLEQALFLAFGVDPAAAKRADNLRREAEKADSLARNANWQATEVRKKMKDLEETAGDVASRATKDLVDEHKALERAVQTATRNLEKVEAEQRDLSIELAVLSSRQASLRGQYEEEFARRIRTTTHVSHHPLVTTSIEEASCGLCGAHGATVAREVRSRSQRDDCPLCGSKVERERVRAKDVARLKELDEELSKTKGKLEDAGKGLQRLERERPKLDEVSTNASARLRAFEKENYSFLVKLSAGEKGGSVAAVVAAYQTQMADFQELKKKHYARRDERRRDLRVFQKELEERYAAAEEQFVPMFKDLAFQFLGLDLDVRMDTRASPATLVLEVNNDARREHHQLSESQRFFIDIALRMALAQFMSAAAGRATLFIDTPEGSLDIAYENRAGNMLAMFAERGFHIAMTANINSSRLLLALAKKLGHARMALCRMTSWTELSEVQVEEEALFEDAYSQIEKALGKPKAKRSK